MLKAWEVANELEQARIEQAAFEAHTRSLAATACNKSLDDETRLRALLEFDSEIWRRRVGRRESANVDDPADKIGRAKKDAARAMLLRAKAANVARGSVRVRKIVGKLTVVEHGDTVAVNWCAVCGKPIPPSIRGRERQTCSGRCRQALHRARAAA